MILHESNLCLHIQCLTTRFWNDDDVISSHGVRFLRGRNINIQFLSFISSIFFMWIFSLSRSFFHDLNGKYVPAPRPLHLTPNLNCLFQLFNSPFYSHRNNIWKEQNHLKLIDWAKQRLNKKCFELMYLICHWLPSPSLNVIKKEFQSCFLKYKNGKKMKGWIQI